MPAVAAAWSCPRRGPSSGVHPHPELLGFDAMDPPLRAGSS